MRTTLKDVGRAGNQGWREWVADVVATPLAKRTPAHEDEIRAAVGLLFLGLSVYYLAAVMRAVRRRSQ